jgi:adenylyltransferase/sulfurtransferase
MRLDDWGAEGQQRLADARVTVVGAGGLGCPLTIYLAAAGVGTIKIIDSDVVEVTNLNRQVLHWADDLGKPKVASAAEKLQKLNPLVRIVPVQARLTDETADELLGDASILVDALDNFPTRFVLNAYAVKTGKPLVHGAIWGWEGRAMTVRSPETACLQCLFEQGPPPGTFPVVGTTPGWVAMVEATEVLKLLLGIGEPLFNRYLIYDALTMTVTSVNVQRRPECPACGA